MLSKYRFKNEIPEQTVFVYEQTRPENYDFQTYLTLKCMHNTTCEIHIGTERIFGKNLFYLAVLYLTNRSQGKIYFNTLDGLIERASCMFQCDHCSRTRGNDECCIKRIGSKYDKNNPWSLQKLCAFTVANSFYYDYLILYSILPRNIFFYIIDHGYIGNRRFTGYVFNNINVVTRNFHVIRDHDMLHSVLLLSKLQM